MERIFTATKDGYYFIPKEAGNPLLSKKIEAMGPTVKSAPGSHHDEIEGNPLLERRVGTVGALPVVEARQPMQDDSGATTGLRRRPDYGESDSYTSVLNDANSKGASAQYVIALEARNRKEASKTATMYVTSIEWDGLKVASFAFGSDIGKAARLPVLTAKTVSKQLLGSKFGVKARPVPTV
jgi:hypothetical protein